MDKDLADGIAMGMIVSLGAAGLFALIATAPIIGISLIGLFVLFLMGITVWRVIAWVRNWLSKRLDPTRNP